MFSDSRAEIPEAQVFKTVFFYCVVIIATPVATFFGCKFLLLDGILGLDSIPSNVYSAIASVVVLHVALGLFIYRAYSDTSPPEKPDKQD